MSDERTIIREERRSLFDRIYAFYDVKILAAALDSGLFEHLVAGPRTDTQLEEATRIPSRVLRALLVSLAAMKLVEHAPEGYVATSKGKRFFARDSKTFMGDVVRFADWQFDSLHRMPELLSEGAIIWEGFNHYLKHVEDEADARRSYDRQRTFNEALAGSATATAKTVLAGVDLSASRSLIDIGGNLGVFSSVVLEAFPAMRATVFDLPQVVPQTRDSFATRGLTERTSAIGGDFVTDPWPTGADLVTFIRIFATRTRDVIMLLLRKAFDILPSGGRALFYEEHVLPLDRNAVPSGAGWASMFIAIGSLGEVRHVDEWEAMFVEAGFTNVKSALGNPWGLVLGTKP